MKQKAISEKQVAKESVKEILKKFATKNDLQNTVTALGLQIDYQINTATEELDEKARSYRDEILNKIVRIYF